jgi:hypothetical protein
MSAAYTSPVDHERPPPRLGGEARNERSAVMTRIRRVQFRSPRPPRGRRRMFTPAGYGAQWVNNYVAGSASAYPGLMCANGSNDFERRQPPHHGLDNAMSRRSSLGEIPVHISNGQPHATRRCTPAATACGQADRGQCRTWSATAPQTSSTKGGWLRRRPRRRLAASTRVPHRPRATRCHESRRLHAARPSGTAHIGGRRAE